MYNYQCKIVRWIDGDTVEVRVDLGFHLTSVQRLRLLGVDTPERGQPGHQEATAKSRDLAPEGSKIEISTEKGDSFGRWLAHLTMSDGRSVAQELIDGGFGVAWVRFHGAAQ